MCEGRVDSCDSLQCSEIEAFIAETLCLTDFLTGVREVKTSIEFASCDSQAAVYTFSFKRFLGWSVYSDI